MSLASTEASMSTPSNIGQVTASSSAAAVAAATATSRVTARGESFNSISKNNNNNDNSNNNNNNNKKRGEGGERRGSNGGGGGLTNNNSEVLQHGNDEPTCSAELVREDSESYHEHHAKIKAEAATKIISNFAMRGQLDYKWQNHPNIIGAIEIPCEFGLEVDGKHINRYVKGREAKFDAALKQVWQEMKLREEFIVACNNIPPKSFCCGLVQDDDGTIISLVKQLEKGWIQRVNRRLQTEKKNIKLDAYLWNWHSAMGKSVINVVLIRFFDVTRVHQPIASLSEIASTINSISAPALLCQPSTRNVNSDPLQPFSASTPELHLCMEQEGGGVKNNTTTTTTDNTSKTAGEETNGRTDSSSPPPRPTRVKPRRTKSADLSEIAILAQGPGGSSSMSQQQQPLQRKKTIMKIGEEEDFIPCIQTRHQSLESLNSKERRKSIKQQSCRQNRSRTPDSLIANGPDGTFQLSQKEQHDLIQQPMQQRPKPQRMKSADLSDHVNPPPPTIRRGGQRPTPTRAKSSDHMADFGTMPPRNTPKRNKSADLLEFPAQRPTAGSKNASSSDFQRPTPPQRSKSRNF